MRLSSSWPQPVSATSTSCFPTLFADLPRRLVAIHTAACQCRALLCRGECSRLFDCLKAVAKCAYSLLPIRRSTTPDRPRHGCHRRRERDTCRGPCELGLSTTGALPRAVSTMGSRTRIPPPSPMPRCVPGCSRRVTPRVALPALRPMPTLSVRALQRAVQLGEHLED